MFSFIYKYYMSYLILPYFKMINGVCFLIKRLINIKYSVYYLLKVDIQVQLLLNKIDIYIEYESELV